MTNDIPLTKRSITVESKEVKGNDWNEQTFFPFQEDSERQQAQLTHHVAAFPKLGIGALAGALFLISLSAVILLVIQGPGKFVSDWTVHVHGTHRHVTIPKPAAWLSAILSGISVCFHIALSEGLNIAWWYHVRQENATIRDLHNIWGHGTSTWNVMQSGARDIKSGIRSLGKKVAKRQSLNHQPYAQRKHFSYVALATLFVATIPLNGFLLQNAVTVQLRSTSDNSTITVPMLNGNNFNSIQQVQANGDVLGGGVSDWSKPLGKLSQVVVTKTAAAVDLGSFNTTCLGTCRTTIEGMGFAVHCEDTTQPYDIPSNCGNYCPNGAVPDISSMVNGTDVVQVNVTYNYTKSNTVSLRSMWKDSATCKGNYSIQTCTLQLATVKYPVVINANVEQATASGVRNTTIMTLNMDLLNEQPVVSKLADDVFVATTIGTTYPAAGLAGLFAQTLNSTINLSFNTDNNDGGRKVAIQGLFAQQQYATTGDFPWGGDSCKANIGNVSAQALATIHSMTFQLGAYSWLSSFGDPQDGANIGTYPSDVPVADWVKQNTPRLLALQSYQRNEYKIVWPWYFGAMTVTLVVSMMILPTFWGYWRLERKTTMSPFETARAFHAPVLYQKDSRIVSDELIKRVGDVHIHRDLPVVDVSSDISRQQTPTTVDRTR
jgi:hypothetical protein